MPSKQNIKDFLYFAVLLTCLIVSLASLYTAVNAKDEINQQLREDLKNELKKYNVPVSTDSTLTEDQIALLVAKYCSTRNDCEGRKGEKGDSVKGDKGDSIKGDTGETTPGKDGITPPCYFTLEQCVGPSGPVGPEGPPGTPARDIERRCNPEKRRMEWRLVGDERWQVEYKLAFGQQCATEGE